MAGGRELITGTGQRLFEGVLQRRVEFAVYGPGAGAGRARLQLRDEAVPATASHVCEFERLTLPVGPGEA